MNGYKHMPPRARKLSTGGAIENKEAADLLIKDRSKAMWSISTRVDKPENDDPSIVEPIELATSAALAARPARLQATLKTRTSEITR